MRNGNYRAWNKEQNVMIYDVGINTVKNGSCMTYSGDGVYLLPGDAEMLKFWDLMQYIHRDDKEAEKIFVGDILLTFAVCYYGDHGVVEAGNFRLGEDEYGREYYTTGFGLKMFDGYYLDIGKPEETKVIGNIWENPDLYINQSDREIRNDAEANR